MPKERFYSPEHFQNDQLLTLIDQEWHHLRVMRPSEGSTIELVNGQHQLAQAKIVKLEKRQAQLQIVSVKTTPQPLKKLVLAQALLKPKNLDLVIEKGTELGATSFWLFPGEKSEKTTLSENQLLRLRQITISALKQCGRLDLPAIELHPPLKEWNTPMRCEGYFGSLESLEPLKPTLSDSLLFIGPESGFTKKEEQLLLSLSISPKSLNKNILRAETAAISGLSILNAL